MIKKLTKHGNSLALVIDRPILDLLNIDADTPLEITTDGGLLIIAPVRDGERRKKFDELLASLHRDYGEMLKRLAD